MDIFISLAAQTLELYEGMSLLARYPVSSAARGAGEASGSLMTPRGRHRIRAKIGGGCPENTVFVGRRPTGERWTPELAAEFPGRDWILTRILWLSGCEPGRNRLGSVDSMRRYIYLHGTPDELGLGTPGSRGCVRMRNADIVELFDRVSPYIAVNIGDFRIAMDHSRGGGLEVRAFDSSGEAIARCLAADDGRLAELEVAAPWLGQGIDRQLLRSLVESAAVSGLQLQLGTIPA